MPTRRRRIQVTEDRELARALHVSAPHLPPGLSRSGQVRELALAGARHLGADTLTEQKRRELLERLAADFADPSSAPFDWDALREGKRLAWPSE
jgi:hypothetical protein